MKPKQSLKFGAKSFFEKTPSLFRRIGNMFFSISTLGGTFAFLEADKRIGYVLLSLAIIGKALTEFFSQDELEKDYKDDTDSETVDALEDKPDKHQGPVTVKDIAGPPIEDKDNTAPDCD